MTTEIKDLPSGTYRFRTKDGYFDLYLGGDDETYAGVDAEFVANAESALDPKGLIPFTRPRVLFEEDFSEMEAPGDLPRVHAVLWENPEEEDSTSDIPFVHFGKFWRDLGSVNYSSLT